MSKWRRGKYPRIETSIQYGGEFHILGQKVDRRLMNTAEMRLEGFYNQSGHVGEGKPRNPSSGIDPISVDILVT